MVLNIALAWVNRGVFPLVSIKSSVGFMNPPLVEYLYALPLFISRDVLGAAWITALANWVALFLTFVAIEKVFGWRPALLVGLLYAVNPWAVYYSQLIWNPTLGPFFATLCLAGLIFYFCVAERTSYLLFALGGLAGTIQTELSAVLLVPVLVVIFLLFRRQLRFPPLLLGMAIFTASFFPYFVYQILSGFPDLQVLREILKQPAITNLAPLLLVLDLLQAKGVFSTLGSAAPAWQESAGPWIFLDSLAVILFLLSVTYATIWILRHLGRMGKEEAARPRMVAMVILLLWLVIPVLFSLRQTLYLQNYYFLYLYPVPFVLVAVFFDDIYLWLKRRLAYRLLVFLPLILWAAGQANLNWVGQQLLLTEETGQPQIRHVRVALAAAEKLLAARPGCPLVILSDGHNVLTSRLALMSEFLGPERVRFAAAGQGLVVPESCALYLLAQPEEKTSTWLETYAQPLPEEIAVAQDWVWRFYDLPPAARTVAVAPRMPARAMGSWENGLTLVNYEVQKGAQPGGELESRLIWRVEERASGGVYHFFNHLLSKDGRLVAQYDGPGGLDSTQWQKGDLLLTWFSIPLPADLAAGRYRLVVGMYAWPEIERVLLTTAQDVLDLGEVVLSSG